MQYVIEFFKSFLKNKKIDLGLDMFPIFHDITTRIAKMYYDTANEDFKSNAMDILQFINSSEKYSRLLENVQHPANQNIYIESKKAPKDKASGFGEGSEESGAKSSQL